jgi:hypothetical protein
MRKTDNPYIGHVVRKVTEYHNIALGTDYQNTVNNRLEKQGEERNFVTQAPKGKKWYNNFFYQSLKDENEFYLKIIFNKAKSHTETRYMIDGRLTTDIERREIESFCYSHTTSQKQADAGLQKENEVIIIAPSLKNVLKITLGDKVIE